MNNLPLIRSSTDREVIEVMLKRLELLRASVENIYQTIDTIEALVESIVKKHEEKFHNE